MVCIRQVSKIYLLLPGCDRTPLGNRAQNDLGGIRTYFILRSNKNLTDGKFE